MRNRKGFTLIEMMIVIAIIAVLVSVVIPVMTGSTEKAAAATNAANLRSVEGELTAMMLVEPDAFGNANDKANRNEEIDTEINDREDFETDLAEAEANVATLQQAADAAKDRLDSAQATVDGYMEQLAGVDMDALKNAADNSCDSGCSGEGCNATHSAACQAKDDAYESAQNTNILLGIANVTLETAKLGNDLASQALEVGQKAIQAIKDGNQAELDNLNSEKFNLYHYEAVDGWIELDNGTKIKAPSSKAVNLNGVVIEKDVPMVVYVNTLERTAFAVYGNYDKSVFAMVASGEE